MVSTVRVTRLAIARLNDCRTGRIITKPKNVEAAVGLRKPTAALTLPEVSSEEIDTEF